MNDILFGDLGLQIIIWLQGLSELLDPVFLILTQFGGTIFYIMIIVVLYLTVQKRAAILLTYTLLFSGWFNGIIKGIVGLTRPYLAHSMEIRQIDTASGYSFPSGHAQSTGSFWGFLFIYGRDTSNYHYIIPIGIVLIVMVPLSRVYLGVHYPSDVLVGLIIGLGFGLLAATYYSEIFTWFQNQTTLIQVLLAIFVPIGMLSFSLGTTILAGNSIQIQSDSELPGAILGISLGLIVDAKKIHFEVKTAKWSMYILRAILGLIIVGIFYLGIGTIFSFLKDTDFEFIREFTRLAVVGFVAVTLNPWLITKIENKLI